MWRGELKIQEEVKGGKEGGKDCGRREDVEWDKVETKILSQVKVKARNCWSPFAKFNIPS